MKRTIQKIEFISYKEGKLFSNSLSLKSVEEWETYCKSGDKPNNIPTRPYVFYKNKGWVSWEDWIGMNFISYKKKFLSYKEGENFVHTLNLHSSTEWYNYWKTHTRPNNIPFDPHIVYLRKGWTSWENWLGNKKIIKISANKKYLLSYNETQKFTSTLGLKNTKEWKKYCKSGNKPNHIPHAPNDVYLNKGWQGIKHWLGIREIKKMTFDELKEFIKKEKIKNHNEYMEFRKKINKDNI